MLFIGEAPPASGRFFYRRDSGLYRAMRDAFDMDDTHFLDAFRDAGYYLVDLCGEPVDDLDAKTRRAACAAAEPSLARKIRQLQPATIVTLLRSIEGNVTRAAASARWEGSTVHLPYPGRWARHRTIFIEKLRPVIKAARVRPRA
jgi:hypothetical protein